MTVIVKFLSTDSKFLFCLFSQAGKFYSTVGFEGFMTTVVCAGMSPVTSLLDLITQVRHKPVENEIVLQFKGT